VERSDGRGKLHFPAYILSLVHARILGGLASSGCVVVWCKATSIVLARCVWTSPKFIASWN
jgi:hypothetical protein